MDHTFWLAAAVCNLNRRAEVATRYLRQVVGRQVRNYHGDSYGFSLIDIDHEEETLVRLYRLLGLDFAEKKSFCGSVLNILGVTYDLPSRCLRIKADRSEKLLNDIELILDSNILDSTALPLSSACVGSCSVVRQTTSLRGR